MPASVYGITSGLTSTAGTASSASSASSGGTGFEAALRAALAATTSQDATATSTASSQASQQFNPLPSRAWVGYSATAKAQGTGQLKALELPPGLVRPPRDPISQDGVDTGQGDDSGATSLPKAISTFGGDYFSQDVGLGAAQQVGDNIYQFHFPHIVQKDGTYYAYFIDHSQGSTNDVGLATSSDGVNFTYQGKVLEKGAEYDANQASFPDVQYDPDSKTWYMLYEGKSQEGDVNSVCLATSSDGRDWTKQGPIIEPGDAGAMSAVDVGTPTLFKENGTWKVYFHGLAQDGRVRIGYASGADLKNLSVKQGAVLDVDQEGLQAGTVGDRSSVVKVGDYYYMAYETSSASSDFGKARWGISLARSTRPDGGWQKLDENIITNPKMGFGYDGPELSVQNGKVYLYYRTTGNGTMRQELTGLADTAQVRAGRDTLASQVKTTANQAYFKSNGTFFNG
ncbi:MAG: family 43 glycosylhydrolase [Pseudomonadota bacterium]